MTKFNQHMMWHDSYEKTKTLAKRRHSLVHMGFSPKAV